ncbi:MAG: thioredoxin-disulfide reductase [bacterium]
MPEKLIILGSGPAGLTAAIYASRASLNPLVIEGADPGGQLMTTTEVENFPGFENGIMGPELMAVMRKQAERFGTRFEIGNVAEVDFSGKVLTLKTNSKTFECESLIISTGASAKWLGLPSETRLRGKGVSACATCDGFFFKNKDIAVVGGGDSAMEEAIFLTRFANSVTIIARGDKLRASKTMQDRAHKNPKIKWLWNSVIDEVLGETVMTGLKIKNTVTGEMNEITMQGLFLAIGHEPNTKLFQGKIELDEKGYIKVKPFSTETGIPGVFAAGDVADHKYRQAISAAGTGCMAALDAERYLANKE